jgi:hypothetical protein
MRFNLSPGGDYFRYWHSKEELWSEGRCRKLGHFIPLPKYGHDPDYVACHYEYIGPVLTPTQIAELLAGERERCAEIARRNMNDAAARMQTDAGEAWVRAYAQRTMANEIEVEIINLGAAS